MRGAAANWPAAVSMVIQHSRFYAHRFLPKSFIIPGFHNMCPIMYVTNNIFKSCWDVGRYDKITGNS